MSFFSRLDPATAASLMTLARHRYHRRGASLFFEGDRAHDVLLLCSGQVKVTRVSSDGREVVLDVVGPGDILGELSAIDGDVRSATATTLTATRVATLSIAEFNAFLERHPGAATALLRAIAGRLRCVAAPTRAVAMERWLCDRVGQSFRLGAGCGCFRCLRTGQRDRISGDPSIASRPGA